MTSPLLLAHWNEFYVLVGTAAAALVALLFVATSIGTGYLGPDRSGPIRTYVSPVVTHFSGVLLVCALALVPTQTSGSLAIIVGVLSLGGIVYSTFIAVRVLKAETSDYYDWFGYGITPLSGYIASAASAIMLWQGSSHAAEVLGAAMILLMAVNIRNAWDTLLALIRRASTPP